MTLLGDRQSGAYLCLYYSNNWLLLSFSIKVFEFEFEFSPVFISPLDPLQQFHDLLIQPTAGSCSLLRITNSLVQGLVV